MNENNINLFKQELTKIYITLFKEDAQYQHLVDRYTPLTYSEMMVKGLTKGHVDKSGTGIKAVCKVLKINNTYVAIEKFLGVR